MTGNNGTAPALPESWAKAVEQALGPEPSEEIAERLRGIASGRIRSIPSPWPTLTRVSQPLLPGAVTVVCGDPGSAKSFLVMQWAAFLHEQGSGPMLLELENDREFHLSRCLVQRCGEKGLLDPAWVKEHHVDALHLHHDHDEFLQAFGLRVFASTKHQVTHQHVLRWMKREATARVFFVDPITACTTEVRPWEADQEFLFEAKKILGDTGTSLVVVTHPKKGRKDAIGFDELAGGAAWSRFTDTVWWLKREKVMRETTISTEFGTYTAEYNRKMVVCKARNGVGQGLEVAMMFDKDNLTMKEIGIITGDSQ